MEIFSLFIYLTFNTTPFFKKVFKNGLYSNSQIDFKSLKPGTYELRILVDENNNGVWDSADFADGVFAEPVYIFEKKIEIRPLWDIRETWKLPLNNLETDSATLTPLNKE